MLQSILLPLVTNVVSKYIPDKNQELQIQSELSKALLDNSKKIEEAASEVVRTEAASSHWLAANWRPLTMLTFVGLIVARWFGFDAPGMTEAEVLKLWSIVELGLGGYVIGRTVEKVAPGVIGALRRRG